MNMSTLDTSPPSCPGCTSSGSLTLLQPGRETTVQGLESRPDLWGCRACGWEGWGVRTALGLQVQVLDPETGHLRTGRDEILECFLEQQHMELSKKGGSGGAKGRRNPKPGEKRQRGRPEQDPGFGCRDKSVIVETFERRSVTRTFRLTPPVDKLLQNAAKARACPVQAILDEALADWFERHVVGAA